MQVKTWNQLTREEQRLTNAQTVLNYHNAALQILQANNAAYTSQLVMMKAIEDTQALINSLTN